MRRFHFIFVKILTIVLLLNLLSCQEDITGNRTTNIPPETFIFVRSQEGDTLNYRESIQNIFWDGRDTDGFITGFFYTWNENPSESDWIWTTERSGSFPLEITGNDTLYTFQIKAVDNLEQDDPTPALQVFPIVNSPPVVDWTVNTRIPDTTFTVASFLWTASDLDGDATISHFEWALDQPSDWGLIPGSKRSVTINADSGLTEGDHVFYLRAVDIAGAKSNIIRMPAEQTWHVKLPLGRYLLIDDYVVESTTVGNPDAYYRSMLSELLPQIGESGGFDYWNIEELFPASRIQFTETLKLYDRIIWYSDLITEGDDHFITAQVAIPEYRQTGGKIIYSVQFNTGFGALGNPLEFSPVDSLGSYYNILLSGQSYYEDPEFQSKFGINLPPLETSKVIVGLIALKPKFNSIPMYRYDDPNLENDPLFIMLGQNDNTSEYDFLFSGTPIHILQGNNNLNEFFRIVLEDIF